MYKEFNMNTNSLNENMYFCKKSRIESSTKLDNFDKDIARRMTHEIYDDGEFLTLKR
jgi:hypothetical protein